MTFVYHGVPENMMGEEILSLNQLRGANLSAYGKNIEKYKGREAVIECNVPLLNCKASDVINLLPFNPKKLFEYQMELGLISAVPSYAYFEIDLQLLNPKETVVFFKTAPGEENVTIKWIKDVDFSELQEIPVATKQYYKSMVGKKEAVFNYQFVPHVLTRGPINIKNCDVIEI